MAAIARTRDKQISDAVNAAGRERDQKALMIAIAALRDIAVGVIYPHAAAQSALKQIEALDGDPFARIDP